MRVTRETLLKIARDTVAQRVRTDRGLIAVYLCGSILEDEFLLGGTTDIDLVFIHADTPPAEREIIRLTDQVHLDIAHHLHRDYRQTRRLRIHPWLGPIIATCTILHDPQHFMDFTQASVRGQFDRGDFVYARARGQAVHAREIWREFHEERPQAGPHEILVYLRAVDHAANAIAGLSSAPLTERRFLLKFPARADAVRRPGLYPGLIGLLGGPKADAATLKAFLPGWERAYDELAGVDPPARLHPDRRRYYLLGIEALLNSEHPLAALWPLLRSWTEIASRLPASSAAVAEWNQALDHLGLLGDGFSERVEAFDAYLDLIEDTLEEWARKNGVEE